MVNSMVNKTLNVRVLLTSGFMGFLVIGVLFSSFLVF